MKRREKGGQRERGGNVGGQRDGGMEGEKSE